MEWDAISALAELLGALGVIASLIYLARQIRQSNSAERLNATLNLQGSYNEVGDLFLRDAGAVSRGLQGLAALNEEDQLKVAVIFHLYFGHSELVHSYQQQGLLDQKTINRTFNALQTYLQYPGTREWWETAGRNTFSEEFTEFVDGLWDQTSAVGHGWKYDAI